MISVLYVDDEPDLLDLTRIFLEQNGEFRVDTLQYSTDVIAQLEKNQYDALISDYQMPDLDGISLLKTVRAKNAKLPFILFTGKGREQIVIEALNNGADFYLQKGGDPRSQFAELMHKIRQAVDKRKAETNLHESEKRLSDIINFLPDPMLAIDRDGVVVAWNLAMEEVTGIPAREMRGKGNYEYAIPFYGDRRPLLIDLIFEPDERISPHYSGIIREKDILIAETYYPRPKGRPMTVMAKASPLYNQAGEVVGAIESIRDITSRKLAEDELRSAYERVSVTEEELRTQYEELLCSDQSLRESEKRFRTLAEHNSAAIFVFQEKILYTNPAGEELLGYSREEIAHLDPYLVIDPSCREMVARREQACRDGKESSDPFEMRIQRKNGEPRWINATATGFQYEGKPAILCICVDITERREMEEDLRSSRQILTNILENFPGVVFWKDRELVYQGCNKNFSTGAGLSESLQILGKTDFEPPWAKTEAESYREHDRMVMESGLPCLNILETQHLADGKVAWFSTNKIPLYGPDKSVIGILGTSNDITDLKCRELELGAALEQLSATEEELRTQYNDLARWEQLLRESEEKFRAIVEQSLDSNIIVDESGTILFANHRTLDIIGYDTEGLMPGTTTVFDFLTPEYRLKAKKDFMQVIAGKDSFLVNYPVIAKGNRLIWIEALGKKISYSGKPAIILSVRDISSRKQADERIARVNKAFLAFGTDPEKNIQLLTALAGELLKASVAIYHQLVNGEIEVIGKWNLPPGFVTQGKSEGHPCYDTIRSEGGLPLVVPDLLDSTYAATDPNVSRYNLRTFVGKPVRIGGTYQGSLCLVYQNVVHPTEQDLDLLSFIANGIAIEDERRLAEQALVEGMEKYRELFELGNVAIILVDNRTSKILEANTAASEMYGYTHEELLALHNTELSVEPEETRKTTIQSRFGSIVIPLRYHKKKDGTIFPVEVTGRFFIWNRRNVHVAAIRDITHYKHTEDALRRANKKLNLLNSVTRHDVANQLTVLQGYAQLSMNNNANPMVMDFLKKIDELSNTISGQIAFTGMYQELGVHAPVWYNLKQILAHVKPAGILVSSNCTDIELFADPMLEKVFANLFDNAIRHGERVTRISIDHALTDDGLLIIVEDNGVGIPLDLKQKIFRKGFGKHTGFGLFLVREILAITGISIHETGKHGTGARFEITVPKSGFRRQQIL
jgi:PAS domain S-box-containing protein